ncbi:phage tail assembly chaperone [Sphingomonas pokkalii]|uniref:Phage tail assembly chaperone n=1 Tax=Sphingomonas pokkalii TaxID=2175090 RepID=A0A2U0SC95_9SPHN|nr:phage tail assembly chaperone [Sphingomonas pokkalii]PVX28996.1 phage tail assembly chaperone [Sphingomonas pokkalii]
MSRFSDQAARLAGMAGLAFGWSPDIFWRSTPAELAALIGAAAGEAGEPLTPDLLARLQEQFPDG